GIPEPVNGLRHQLYVWCRRNNQGVAIPEQHNPEGLAPKSEIASVGPFSPFPTRTKMRLKLLAAGKPPAISPAGRDLARPGRPRRTTPLPAEVCPIPTGYFAFCATKSGGSAEPSPK